MPMGVSPYPKFYAEWSSYTSTQLVKLLLEINIDYFEIFLLSGSRENQGQGSKKETGQEEKSCQDSETEKTRG